MIWTNNSGIYTVLLPDKVNWTKIKREMDELEKRLQVAEAEMAARKGMTA